MESPEIRNCSCIGTIRVWNYYQFVERHFPCALSNTTRRFPTLNNLVSVPIKDFNHAEFESIGNRNIRFGWTGIRGLFIGMHRCKVNSSPSKDRDRMWTRIRKRLQNIVNRKIEIESESDYKILWINKSELQYITERDPAELPRKFA